MEKRLNILHILLHFCYQAVAGIFYGFGVYMLVNRGYSSAIAGLLMSLCCGLSVCISPLVSNFLDSSKKVTVYELVIVESFLVMTMFICNSLFTEKSLLLSIVFIIGGGFYSSMEPMINTYASIFHNQGMEIDYGKARAAGSFGYGSVCVIFGLLTAAFGYLISIFAGVLFAGCLCIVSFLIRRESHKVPQKEIVKEKEETISFADFIKNNIGFIVLCICLTGLFISYTGADNFTLLLAENVGGDSGDMGMILGFKAALEAISIFFFSKITKKFKLETVLMIAAISFTLKMIATWLAPSVFFLYVAQLFQVTSFAMMLPGMVEYVNVHMKKNEINRGQSFVTMTIGLGSLVSGTLSGMLIDAYGVYMMGLVFTIISATSSLGYVLTLKRITK